VLLEGLGKLGKKIHLIVIGTRELPACSIVIVIEDIMKFTSCGNRG
jgi:hypothetical protein